MATVGLTVQNSPLAGNLSLADTLAKSIFGDPEGEMKARVMASQVGAHQAYRDKLIADTGLVNVKTREEQALADAQDAAAKAGPVAANAAVPMPVPVEAPRENAPGTTGYGPQPGIVDANAVKMHDAIIAQNNALWPILVRTSQGTQLIEGAGKLTGGAALEGGLTPGGRSDPDALRLASTLYTGNAPTTSTVITSSDYAGVDAAARQKILEERARPPEPKMFGDQPYTVQLGPDGKPLLTPTPGFQPTPKAPERQVVNDQIWERDTTTGKWAPVEGGPQAPVKPVQITKDTMLPPDPNDPTGTYRSPKTDRPTIIAGPYDDINSVEGRNNKTVRDIMSLTLQPIDPLRPNPITPQMAYDYDQAYTGIYGSKVVLQKVPNTDPSKGPLGEPVDAWVKTWPDRPGFLSPKEMFKRAGVAPPTPEPPVVADGGGGGGPPPMPTIAGGSGGAISPPVGPVPKKSLTTEQEKAQTYLAMGHDANAILSQFNRNNIPSGFEIGKAQFSSSPGPISSIVGAFTGSPAKRYNGAAKAFIEAYARPATGATISPADYQNFYGALIPLPTDDQFEFDRKTRLRAKLEDVWINGSGFPDEASRDAWFAKNVGPLKREPQSSAPVQAPDDKPPASYPGTPAGWAKMPPEKRKLFQ